MTTFDITATDMFCGAGGSTTGATLAGVSVTLAINHWKRAIETHHTNYPETEHALTDLHKASPRKYPGTTILMASPECTSHTLARGRKRTEQGQLSLWHKEPDLEAEAEERSRCTMWTPLDWAEYHNYQAVVLENVVDAHLWRPFEAWLHAWKSLDYDFEPVYLNSMHAHPTPQSRDRMYFVAWKRGNRKPDLTITPSAYCHSCDKKVEARQVWKNQTRRYGKYRQQYVYCCPTCAKEVVPYYYAAANAIDWTLPAPRIGDRVRPLCEKTMERIAYGLQKFAHDSNDLTVPPFILDHVDEYRPRAISRALSTICAAGNHHSLVTPPAWLMTYYQHGQMYPIEQAIPTVTTLERHALITTPASLPDVENCGFRMLLPKEIQAAMAFPNDYILTGTRREQVRQLGNAVTPPVMRLLMERVVASLAG